MKVLISLSIILITLFILSACEDGNMKSKDGTVTAIDQVDNNQWRSLEKKTIFFGHQSVGDNIINGIENILKENSVIPIRRIIKTRSRDDFDKPIFAHAYIGENLNPKSKILDYEHLIKEEIGDKVDIAFMKLCFVDINIKTNINEIFNVYKTSIHNLHLKYPDTIFVHITVPLLRREKTNIKTIIKKIIGRKDTGYFADVHNIARNEFNDLIRKEYQGKEPIFDLAMFESTYPNGERAEFKNQGKTYYYLIPEYTPDDGHLNELAQKRIAQKLLEFLAKLDASN